MRVATIEINHAGKKDPRMLTDGDTPQPGRAMRMAAASDRIGRPTVASEDVMRVLACASPDTFLRIGNLPSAAWYISLVATLMPLVRNPGPTGQDAASVREPRLAGGRRVRLAGAVLIPESPHPHPSTIPKRDSNILRCVHSDGNRLASSHGGVR